MYTNPHGSGSGSRIPKPVGSGSGFHTPGIGMSPSTIGSSPRPGGGGYTQSPRVLSSGSGSGSSTSHTSSPAPTSPRPDTPQYRTGANFTRHPHPHPSSQLQLQQQHQQQQRSISGSGGGGNGTAPLSVSGRRRAGQEDSPSTPIAGGRRVIPNPAPGSLLMPSPEISGLPRLSSLNHGSRNGNGQNPHSTPTSNLNSTLSPPPTPIIHRNSPRQVSTPTLGPNAVPRKPVTDPMPARQRPRSQSALSPSTPTVRAPPPAPAPDPGPDPDSTPDATSISTKLQSSQALTPVSGMADRVPLHIRVRLRLIHQLGTVLDLDAQGIASKVDIPGLLARVDAAYDRGHADLGLGLPLEPAQSSGASAGGERKGGMMSVLKRIGGASKVKAPLDDFGGYTPKVTVEESTGPAFGVALHEMPGNAWCTSLIGGQKHELPLVVFTVIEEIYRRGMSHPGIFRLAGDGTRISHLTKAFNLPPLYGDSLSITHEPIHNLTGLVKRYIRDLPEPILDESLFTAFIDFCVDRKDDDILSKSDHDVGDAPTNPTSRPLSLRVTVAQILLRLLPPLHFSLFIYLLAFLGQLPLFPDNRLNIESISIIFGPAMAAARGRGIAGLGPNSANTKTRPGDTDADTVSELVNGSQAVLSWLLRHWSAISEKVLQGFELPSSLVSDEKRSDSADGSGLLGPADIKSGKQSTSVTSDSKAKSSNTVVMVLSESTKSSSTGHSEMTPASKDNTTPSRPVSSSGGGGGGIFARAFGSRPLSGGVSDHTPTSRKPKRSASFTSISSISSLMKKGGGGWLGRSEPKGPNLEAARSLSAEKLTVREPEPNPGVMNPQISNVLGSLHDLLVSKDKQIERDARELALLRHTILELDEKIAKTQLQPQTTSLQHAHTAPMPEIKITTTGTPSSHSLSQANHQEISELQSQLTTTLAALETARLGSKGHEQRILELEARLSRADSERKLEVGKLQVELAIEQGRVVALSEQRDQARERLERIKTTLFAIA